MTAFELFFVYKAMYGVHSLVWRRLIHVTVVVYQTTVNTCMPTTYIGIAGGGGCGVWTEVGYVWICVWGVGYTVVVGVRLCVRI